MDVKIPKLPPMTDLQKVAFATEVAFSSLLAEARKVGLKLNPVMGLVYLPDMSATIQFQAACTAVLLSLHERKAQ